MKSDPLDTASKQLDRVLAFFPRVDAKVTWLFATNVGLLALACLNFHPGDIYLWYVTVPISLTFILVLISMYFLYLCSFPHLKGGAGSLFYFREIAGRTEANFIREFEAMAPEVQLRDLLGQIWRNSEILKTKFHAVRISFILTALALVPWCWLLIAVALVHAQIPALK